MSARTRDALAWAGTFAAIIVLPVAFALGFLHLHAGLRWLLAGVA